MTIEDFDEILKYADNLRVNCRLLVSEYEKQLALNPTEAVERTKQYIRQISLYGEDCYGL